MGRSGLSWAGLGWAGLDWTGLFHVQGGHDRMRVRVKVSAFIGAPTVRWRLELQYD